MVAQFKMPNETERTVIFGRTGSGKSVFAVWLLSRASIEDRPWIILDYKRDKYLRNIPYVKKLKLGELPKKPGVYIVDVDYDPNGSDEEVAVNEYLFQILRKGNIGLFVDEGSNLPQREPKFKGLKAIFAQGRSKRVPFIFATQRPSWINKSVLSEADHYVCFDLAIDGDVKRVHEFMPGYDPSQLARFHSFWYDVKQRTKFLIGPVDETETFDRLNERLKPVIRLI